MADETPKLIQIAPKDGEKKDGFNLVTERVVAVNPESKQLEGRTPGLRRQDGRAGRGRGGAGRPQETQGGRRRHDPSGGRKRQADREEL